MNSEYQITKKKKKLHYDKLIHYKKNSHSKGLKI